MDTSAQYGQQDFNLPHDVVELPSRGKFYANGKSSIKVGYLTAADENSLLGQRNPENIIQNLLRAKIYEPNMDINGLLDCDVEAILIFLRNTSFGSKYTFTLRDPKTLKEFETSVTLDELSIKKPTIEPDTKGLFEFKLPKSGKNVKCRLLTIGDTQEISKLEDSYPEGVIIPTVTKRLEKTIIEIDGINDKAQIAQLIQSLPIADSKYIRSTMRDAEPRLELERVFTAPSGEKVTSRITFGAEFFRPFF
tara:strand:- start:928 stop:1677 length:750 start_codon:yes stop_codon:yes gene_type:complete